ncbi:uncharacterized protein magl [Brachyistius frenatus]|uniref:uncharacterized protein magl n=1 Tax=Brachyistius frenatus TaxID=100188 RepID=UPI0037E9ABF4
MEDNHAVDDGKLTSMEDNHAVEDGKLTSMEDNHAVEDGKLTSMEDNHAVDDGKLTSMEDNHAVDDEKRSLPTVLAPPTSTPSSAPPFPTTTTLNFTGETVIENKAAAMTSNDCSTALASPAEASPAKSTSSTTFDWTVETSSSPSHIASASDSLTRTGASLVNISESLPWSSASPSTTFGSLDLENDFPTVLTFKGVSVMLENNSVWRQFYSCGTEMILTKPGRRMFPYCQYRLVGLDPERRYSLVLSIVPSGHSRYRWNSSKWEVTGRAEHQTQGLIRAFSHHRSPCRGSEWMCNLVSFYKLKLTNNCHDQDGHIILHSMHRYIPRLHVIPVPDDRVPSADQPVVVGPESMTFTFPQTEFMSVTTYQNFRITQLKINHNPFAKGFREDGNNPRLNKLTADAPPLVETDTQPPLLQPAENKQEDVDLGTKNHSAADSLSSVPETRLVLKPIMSNPAGRDEAYVPCIRGKHALGELVLVQKSPLDVLKEEKDTVSITPEAQQRLKVWMLPEGRSVTSTSSTSTPASLPGYRKRRKRINRRWANSRGRDWKAVAASPTVIHSPSLTVAMQPELDNVEGLLFVSFTSKEALEVHARDKAASTSPPSPLVSPTTQIQSNQTMEVNPETDEEKIARLEAVLLIDLRVFKHRQVIHPVLQEVGLKLSSLDPTQSIDLQYLGVCLPLPPPNLPEQRDTTVLRSPGDEGLPFVSRTGKTSDMTQIKGWKNKFIRNKETTLNSEGLQKNLSAFCSNMLDEYLESEAQKISERAAAFSTNPEDSVAYQLPVKSSSYVKTLDSVLKHRNAASKLPVGANRPCPLSYKPFFNSTLSSAASSLASAATSSQAEAQSASSHVQPGAASGSSHTSDVSERSSTCQPRVSRRPAVSVGQSQGMTHRPSGLTKSQLKLLQMEAGALNEGLSKTLLTPGRVSAALSVILTKEMHPSEKAAPSPQNEAAGPECGQQHCRLGCVCSSLLNLNRGPLHCRRPECMFGCACFKRKITKQTTTQESEQQTSPVYSMTNMEHSVQPRPGSHANKLWNRNTHDVDPEPVFSPSSSSACSVAPKVGKRIIVPHPRHPIREEDKDPVYKYLESMMTCARVREFNNKPPPEAPIHPMILAATTPNTTTGRQKTTNKLPKQLNLPIVKKTEKKPQEPSSDEKGASKQIEIQSACQWMKDRKVILQALYQRMNRNRLSRRFYVGPYRLCPVTKIFMRKPSGSTVTYRVHISKPSKASDDDEEEFDDGDEEKQDNKSSNDNIDEAEEDGIIEEQEMPFGVTPFLGGVIPAGSLKARRKPIECQASGLIQVNGNSYNQASLLLGNMGSLHPANHLAAYVTGRLQASGVSFHKNSQSPDSANTPGSLHMQAAGTVRRTTDLRALAQPPVLFNLPDSWKKGYMPAESQNSSTINSVRSFLSSRRSSVHSRSTSSPVSLTVSPSLKNPSFLGESGTYSFRICPPSNQGTRDQKLPGVTLPGGFTLIELPNPGADGAETETTTNMASKGDRLPQNEGALNIQQLTAKWLGWCTLNEFRRQSRSRLEEPGPSTGPACEQKLPQSDAANRRQAAKQMRSSLDISSGDLSSDSSDYCADGDEDDESVDIETIEDVRRGTAIAKMKEVVFNALKDSRDNGGPVTEHDVQDQTDVERNESKYNRRRKNHTVLERLRRSEQRLLFNKLQAVLQCDRKSPRLDLLSLALKEIRSLVKTSKHLEEQKEILTHIQSSYVGQLSLLTGKPEKLIRYKLNEIWERQKKKEKWMPYFSYLLQSRAALLQDTAASEPSLFYQLDYTPSSLADPLASAAQINVEKILSLLRQPNLQNPPARPCMDMLGPPQGPAPQLQPSLLQQPNHTAPSQSKPLATAAQNNVDRILPLRLQPSLQNAPAQYHVNTPRPPQNAAQPSLKQQPNYVPPSHVNQLATTAQNNVDRILSLLQKPKLLITPAQSPVNTPRPPAQSLPQAQSSPAQAEGTAPPSQVEIQPGEPLAAVQLPQHSSKLEGQEEASGGSDEVSGPNSQTEHQPQAKAAQARASSVSSTPKHPFALPLIRSKTGRLILPSCLKPMGQGFYTLTLMKSKQKGQEGKLNSSADQQPSDVDSSKNLETNVSASKQPSDSVSGTAPKSSGEKTSLAKLGLLNKTIFVPLVDLKAMANSQNGGIEANLNKALAAARLNFNIVPKIPPVETEREASPPVSHHCRDGPRKKRGHRVSDSKISMEVEGGQCERAVDAPEAVSGVADSPVPVKRSRGRPRKNKSARQRSSPSESSSPSKSNEDSPVSFQIPAKKIMLGDVNTSRPLTRGALGKDFPSAKKRSWRDVEKELEGDPEFE